MNHIILASKSPRRIELLERFGIPAVSRPADINETLPAHITEPAAIVSYLAEKKAAAIYASVSDGTPVVGADTLVFIGGEVLGKPKDKDDAARMMRLLSGATHTVVTGLCVVGGERKIVESVATDVLFRTLDEDEIARYVATDEPYDKAGGYGVQAYGGAFVREVRGDYYNVMGLPVCRLLEILKTEFGVLPSYGKETER